MLNAAQKYDEENLKYLRTFLGNDKVDTFIKFTESIPFKTYEEQKSYRKVEKCLIHMEKFENNRWWTSEKKENLAYYQLRTPVMLIPMDKYIEALKYLLGRPVWTHEIRGNRKNLFLRLKKLLNANRTRKSSEQNQ